METTRAEIIIAQQAGNEPEELRLACNLDNYLTIAGREREAADLLEATLARTRKLQDRKAEIAALLWLGTAQQYLDQRGLALTTFEAALRQSEVHGIDDFRHFILHHQSRCFVELSQFDRARSCFEKALALRQMTVGQDQRVASSKRALEELRELVANGGKYGDGAG